VRGVNKRSLYLPIEIKAREFNSKILVACEAAKRGYRVYIGRKAALDELSVSPYKKKGGVYFYKSGNLRDKLEVVNKAYESLVVLDEEMGVAVQDIEYFYRTRISHIESIDRYFVISEKHRRIVESLRPEMTGRVKVTGWPRVDLWRDEFVSFYCNAVAEIKSIHSDFFLFSSDFGFLNEDRIREELINLRAAGSSEANVGVMEGRWRNSMREYRAFLSVLKDLDSSNGCPRIIVRPHPAEDHQQWVDDLKGLKNIVPIYEGEITAWLLASMGLIHRGCTTAVQAYVSGVPSIYYGDNAHGSTREGLTCRLSVVVSSPTELLESLHDVLAGCFYNTIEPPDFKDEIYIGERLAVENILDEIDSLCLIVEPAYCEASWYSASSNFKRKLRGLRLKYGLFIDKRRVARHFRKFPEGVTSAEVVSCAMRLFPLESFSVREVIPDVVCIESDS
jgi:surface carbohydrate biosynthesis protein